MSRRIDYRATVPYIADDVAAVMLDADYLRARLQRLGGPGAALLAHRADPTGGTYRIRHGIDESALPSIIRTLASGDLVVERTETLRRSSENSWAGTTDVRIPGTPASAVGTIAVTGTGANASNSELHVAADVTVSVPIVGGRIEGTIADQVKELLEAETAFTLEWLKR